MKNGILTFMVAVIGVAAGIGLSMKPWHVYAEQKRSALRQIAEMKQVESEHIQDLQKEARLSSFTGREQLARENGFHRIGEVAAEK